MTSFYFKREIRSVELGVCPLQLFHFWSRHVHPVRNLLLCTKFRRIRMFFFAEIWRRIDFQNGATYILIFLLHSLLYLSVSCAWWDWPLTWLARWLSGRASDLRSKAPFTHRALPRVAVEALPRGNARLPRVAANARQITCKWYAGICPQNGGGCLLSQLLRNCHVNFSIFSCMRQLQHHE